MHKTWKAGMISILSASMFTFGTSAFAAGTTNDQPKVSNTPDHFFYFLNRWQEDFHLWLTFDPAKKSELLSQYAQERLAEAKKMIQENKKGYTSSLMKSYLDDINNAQKDADQAITNKKTDDQTKEQLMKDLDQATEVDQTVQKQMDSQETKQLAEQKQNIILNANVVKDLDPKTVKTLRDQGLGYGEIVKVVALAKATGKDQSEIVSMLKGQHQGFGEIYKTLGVSPKELAQKIIDSKIAALQNDLDQAKSSGNQKTVDKITKTLNHLTAKKTRFEALAKLKDLQDNVKQQADQVRQKATSGDLSNADAKKQLSDLKQQAKQQFQNLKQTALDQIGKQDDQSQTKADNQQDSQKTDGVENETAQQDKQKSEDAHKPNDHAVKGLKIASEHKHNPNKHADKGQKIASEHKSKTESDQEEQKKADDQQDKQDQNYQDQQNQQGQNKQGHENSDNRHNHEDHQGFHNQQGD